MCREKTPLLRVVGLTGILVFFSLCSFSLLALKQGIGLHLTSRMLTHEDSLHVFPGQQVAEAAHITHLLGWGRYSPFFLCGR